MHFARRLLNLPAVGAGSFIMLTSGRSARRGRPNRSASPASSMLGGGALGPLLLLAIAGQQLLQAQVRQRLHAVVVVERRAGRERPPAGFADASLGHVPCLVKSERSVEARASRPAVTSARSRTRQQSQPGIWEAGAAPSLSLRAKVLLSSAGRCRPKPVSTAFNETKPATAALF
jgi:hypothetical protein